MRLAHGLHVMKRTIGCDLGSMAEGVESFGLSVYVPRILAMEIHAG